MKQLLFALTALLIVLYFAKPASPWEFDEYLFYQGIHNFDPIAHHPPPPGFPVFMAAGHLARLLIPTDFAALVTLSFAGSLAGCRKSGTNSWNPSAFSFSVGTKCSAAEFTQ